MTLYRCDICRTEHKSDGELRKLQFRAACSDVSLIPAQLVELDVCKSLLCLKKAIGQLGNAIVEKCLEASNLKTTVVGE